LNPVSRTLEDYDNVDFVDDDFMYSSGTYRIDAVRLLGKVMVSMHKDSDASAFDRADDHLTNWSLHLPDAKRKPMDRDGNVDEILFEAHMIVAA
jgi:hypothetical protein